MIMKMNALSINQKIIALTATGFILFASAFQVISVPNPVASQDNTAAKSLAWYTANIKEARAQNQICHDNPELQSSENCENALHALQITFKGGN